MALLLLDDTRRDGLPPGPRMPAQLLGWRFLLDEPRLLAAAQRRHGDIFTLDVPTFDPLIVVADPAEIKRLFTGPATTYHAGEGNAVLEPVVGRNSVLLLDETRHLAERRLMLPAFHGKRMHIYGDVMRDVTHEELERWPLHEPFALHPGMQRITLRVILRAIFGIADAPRLALLERAVVRGLDAGQWPLLVEPLQRDWGARSPWGRFLRARAAIDRVLFDEIARRRAAGDAADRDDVLSQLLQATRQDGDGMTDEELRDELLTLLVAGHETSATGLAWTFERLLRHPEILRRLRAELAAGEDGYLDLVVKEALRVRPVLNYAMRRLTRPTEVGAYTAPAGATLGASTYLVHRRSDIYPEPERFLPERYEERPTETYTWIPFGGGVRRCLGAAFATFEMKTVLRTVLERCDLHAPDPRDERRRRRAITYVPARGTRVVLDARRDAA